MSGKEVHYTKSLLLLTEPFPPSPLVFGHEVKISDWHLTPGEGYLKIKKTTHSLLNCMLILMILTKLTNLRTQVFILSKWHNLTLFSFYYSQRKSVAKEVYTMVFTTGFLSWIIVSFWSKPKPYLIKSYSSFSVFFTIICWLCFIFSNYIFINLIYFH